MFKGCNYAFSLVLSFFILSARGQQLNFKTYSFDNGLKSYNIFNTAQDQYGFIWVATQDGLYRFNGKSFQPFKNNNISGQSTPGNAFMDVTFDRDNHIYAADFRSSIDIFNTTDLSLQIESAANTKNNITDYWITDIFIDSKGTIWLRGLNFFGYRKKNQRSFTIHYSLPGATESISPVFIRQLGPTHVAVGLTGFGTVIYDMESLTETGRIKKFDPGSGTEFDEIKDITSMQDTVVLVTDHSVITGKWEQNRWKHTRTYRNPVLNNTIVSAVVCDSSAILWIGTNAGLVRASLNNESFIRFQVIPGKTRWLADNNINNLMIDKDENLWISTSNVLQMVNTRSNGFRAFNGGENGDVAIDHIYTLCKKDEENIFATGTNGLFIVNIQTGSTTKVKGTENLGYVHHIENVEPDYWLLSTDAGMYVYQASGGKISQELLLKKYPEWKPYSKFYFNTAYRTSSAFYWASEEMEGLIKWDMRSGLIHQFKAGTKQSGGIPENHIRNIKADRDGHLWLLSDFSATCFDTKQDRAINIIHKTPESFNSSLLFDIYDDGGTLWFATYGGGINGFHKKNKKWSYFTEADGLANNCVYGLVPENDTVIWATTNMGLSRFNTKTRRSTNYYYGDGLHDNSFDEKGTLADGKFLYFGGVKGFTQLNLNEKVNEKKEYPIYIHMLEYYVGGKKYFMHHLTWDKVSLPRKTGTVNIHLSELNFAANNQSNFSYQIDNNNDEFIEVSENNIISLNGLSHGHHKINIRYRKKDGSFSDQLISLSIHIKPRWFESGWFRIVLLLLAIGIITGIFTIRVQQLKKEEMIRNQLASDLHDDLGSTLNSIKVHSNLALMEKDNPNHLLLIKQGTQDAISGVRDIIWVLDDKKDLLGDILARISQFAEPLCFAQKIQFRAVMEDETLSVRFGKEEKRNLYMILKESINNSLKYAQCHQIEIRTSKPDKKLRIEISDDGIGFDSSIAATGYGLQNIRNRAKTVGYQASINSEPGKGTRIILEKK